MRLARLRERALLSRIERSIQPTYMGSTQIPKRNSFSSLLFWAKRASPSVHLSYDPVFILRNLEFGEKALWIHHGTLNAAFPALSELRFSLSFCAKRLGRAFNWWRKVRPMNTSFLRPAAHTESTAPLLPRSMLRLTWHIAFWLRFLAASLIATASLSIAWLNKIASTFHAWLGDFASLIWLIISFVTVLFRTYKALSAFWFHALVSNLAFWVRQFMCHPWLPHKSCTFR